MSIRYAIIFITLFYTATGVAQNIVIQFVKENTSRPIPGASVKVVNHSRLVFFTDSLGKIGLSAHLLPCSIEVSSIGFAKELISIDRNATSPYIISLKPTMEHIEDVEVFATGYQKISKERSTGAFEHVTAKDLNRYDGRNILERLKNQTSSIYFDQGQYSPDKIGTENADLTMRGLSTLRADATGPLIILDDFPYQGNIQDINPNDVESITLLKDAASASIWGAQAGNGVIVIVSKKGKDAEKVDVNIKSSFRSTSKPRLKAEPLITTSTYVDEIEKFLFDKGYFNAFESNTARPAIPPLVELRILNRDGKMSDTDLEMELNRWKSNDLREDYLKYVYRNRQEQQYFSSISGGSSKYRFYTSLGFDKSLETLKSNANNRLSLLLQQDIELSERLSLTGSLKYVVSNTIHDQLAGRGIGYTEMKIGQSWLYPYLRLADDGGSSISTPYEYRLPYIEGAGNGLLLNWNFNLLDELNAPKVAVKGGDILANFQSNYRISKGLSAKVIYQYQKVNADSKEHFGLDSYYTRNLINRYSSITNSTVDRGIPLGGILNSLYRNTVSHQLRGQLDFNKDWAGIHKLVLLLGGELRQKKAKAEQNRFYGYDAEYLTYISELDYKNTMPIFDGLSFPTRIPTSSYLTSLTDRDISLFFNGSYNLLDRYNLTASIRKDASNMFGVLTNQKWTPLWSAGMSWDVHKESFYQVPVISKLKWRLTYGFAGNVDNSMSALTRLVYSGGSTNYNVDLPYATISTPGNPELRWEKVGTINSGLDIGLFNNKWNFSIDYYIKNTDDLIAPYTLDPSTGVPSLSMNAARTKTKGIDLSVNGKTKLTNSLYWNSSFSFSKNKNKVVDYFLARPNASNYMVTGLTPEKGYLAYPMFSYKWAGLDPSNGDPQGYLNGELSKNYNDIIRLTKLEDLVYSGSRRPLVFGYFRNAFSYKEIEVSATIGYNLNYYFRRPSFTNGSITSGRVHSDYYQRWQQSGDESSTSIPSFVYPINSSRDQFYAWSSALVDRADNIRLEDVRLQYTGRINSKRESTYNLYITATNLGILWKKAKGDIDPQVGGGIPNPRTFSLGTNWRF